MIAPVSALLISIVLVSKTLQILNKSVVKQFLFYKFSIALLKVIYWEILSMNLLVTCLFLRASIVEIFLDS